MGTEEDVWAQEEKGDRGVEKATQRGALCSVLLNKYYSGDQIAKNEMGEACDTCGGQGKCILGFGGETRGKGTTQKTQEQIVVILKWLFQNGVGRYGIDRSLSGYGQAAQICKSGNELSGSIKFGEFIGLLKNSQLLSKDSVSCSQLVSQLVR